MIKAGIVGITGYTGEELLRILSKHPEVQLTILAGRETSPVRELADIYPKYSNLKMKCIPFNVEEIKKNTDVVFLALPHAVAFAVVPQLLKAGKKVIDLSADFRLKCSDTYEKWYKVNHTGKDYIKDAVYGLSELYADKIKQAKLVANPGCYPTTILLGLAPAVKNGFITNNDIIIDSKSGISGAGRKAVEKYFKEEHPNTRAYNIAGKHRHIPEIEQEISNLFGQKTIVTFTPHIIPVERGMLSVIYANLNKKITTAEAVEIYKTFYKGKNFVKVLDENVLPNINKVVNTNFCEIGLSVDARTNKLVIVSAIDNLVKGASGQAVQNMNIMSGLDETAGLKEII